MELTAPSLCVAVWDHLSGVSQAHHGVYEETPKDRKEKPNGNDWAATGQG